MQNEPISFRDEAGVTVTATYPPRFDVTDDKQAAEMLQYLEENGYAVVASVASEEQVAQAKIDFWDAIEKYRPAIKRNEPDTWVKPAWPGVEPSGIISHPHFNHSPFCWNTRLLPKVKKAFELVWGEPDLTVSFDGGNGFRPWKRNPLWMTDHGWWHVDQNNRVDGHHGKACVQGLVVYTDADETTGGLCVIPRSHLHHDELCDRLPRVELGLDFLPIREKDPLLVGGILVCARAGDLLLWDSRTIHCNTPALAAGDWFRAQRNRPTPQEELNQVHNELIRIVSYVCMLPASRATREILESRREGFRARVATSHWPNQHIKFLPHSDDPQDFDNAPIEMKSLIVGAIGASGNW